MRIAPHLRRRAALWLCPELIGRPAAGTKAALLTLANTLARHDGVTHYAISMRAMNKGDFFKRLMEPEIDCRTRTAAKLIAWFDANWPDDLEWPEGIHRPDINEEVR